MGVAEEIEKASTVIPMSMLASVGINGTLGFAMVIATLFCLGNVEDAINTTTGFPFIEVFVNATGSVGAATCMVNCCDSNPPPPPATDADQKSA